MLIPSYSTFSPVSDIVYLFFHFESILPYPFPSIKENKIKIIRTLFPYNNTPC